MSAPTSIPAPRSTPGASPGSCRHHWVIAPPNGATSMGRCRRCHGVREFPNSADDLRWDRESSAIGGAAWGRLV